MNMSEEDEEFDFGPSCGVRADLGARKQMI